MKFAESQHKTPEAASNKNIKDKIIDKILNITSKNSVLTEIFDMVSTIYKQNKKNKNFLYTVYSCFLLFSPILISLDRFIGLSGTLLTGVPFVLGLLIIIQEKKYIRKYSVITILFLMSVIINKDFINGFETFKPLMIFLFSLDLCCSADFLVVLKRCFIKLKKAVFIMLVSIVGLNLIMVLFPSGYSIVDTETWGLEAYMGLYSSPHQAAYRFSMLIVFIVYMFLLNYNKLITIIMLFITTFLLFKTGARTPTLIGIFVIIFLLFTKRKELLSISKTYICRYKTAAKIVLPIIGIIMIALLLKSAFVQKIINLSSESFDSGRSILRNHELKYFIKSNLFNMLFGNPLDTVYNVNHMAIGARIWCHNDFMQILMQFGILGLAAYLYSCGRFVLIQIKEIKSKETKTIFYLIVLLFAFVSFYNGLFFFPRFAMIIPLFYIMIRDGIKGVKK